MNLKGPISGLAIYPKYGSNAGILVHYDHSGGHVITMVYLSPSLK